MTALLARRIRFTALAAGLLAALAGGAFATEATLNSWWSLANNGTWNPADPLVAAGPRGLLGVNNDKIRYMDKSGEVYPDYVSLDTRDFFTPPTSPNILNDPRVLYDPQSERFFVTCSDFAASGVPDTSLHAYLSIAVSTNSHPKSLADWVHHRFDVTRIVGSGASEVHYTPDYPQIGVDEVAFHVTGNYFRLPVGSSGQNGVGILSFPKAQLLSGGPVTPRTTFVGGPAFTLQPVSRFWSSGPGDVAYFVEMPWFASTSIRLWALSDPFGARTLTSTSLPAPEHGTQIDLPAPQAATTVRIRSFSGVAQAMAQWHDGHVWFVATGDTVEGGQPRARAHWYRVDPNGFPVAAASVVESGVVDGGAGEWTFLPALGITPRGDVGIVFQQSSASRTPTMRFTGRAAGAPAFAPPITVKASLESALLRDYPYPCGSCTAKWGDDYTVSADPADSSLWLSCQLVRSPQNGIDAMWLHETANVIFDDNLPAWPAAGRRVRQGQTAIAALALAADDSGGVYLGWHDRRRVDDRSAVIFAQRVTGTGAHAGGWPVNGVALQPAGGNAAVRAVSDGSGGVYLYCLLPNGSVPTMGVIRLGRQGGLAPGWPATPVVVASSVTTLQAAAADGAGGLLAAYSNGGLRVQRVGPTGVLAWPSPPQVASSAAQVDLAPDMAGGAFVSWISGGHVRIQHLLGTGALDPQWPATGLDAGVGVTPRIAVDGAGGVYVAYAAGGDLLARRLHPDGSAAPGWASPVVVCGAAGAQTQPAVAADGSGGLLLAWSDLRDAGAESDIFAQRLTGSGALAPGWVAHGLRLCGAPGEQTGATVAADGSGGVLVAWTDTRTEPGCSGAGCGSDIYWSHVSSDGFVDGPLRPDGAPAGVADGDQSSPAIARTGEGLAIAAWLDGRSTPDGDPAPLTQVFAQQLAFVPSGVDVPPLPPARIADGLGPPRPNPTRSAVRFEIRVSEASDGHTLEVGVFDVSGRLISRILPAARGPAGVRTLEWDLRDGSGRRVRTGRYFLRLRVDARTYTRPLSVR